MKDVKKEIFGSRNSTLEPVLKAHNIDFISNIWVVSCIQALNRDKNSRYLVIIEGEYNDDYKHILEQIHPEIALINVRFFEEEKKILVYNIRTQAKGNLTYEQFKNRIIAVTKCKYVDSYAKGSKASTPLSRFFREHMGSGFAVTDLDFYLTKKQVFIEEKNFINNNFGYLGVGQCISYKEISKDIFPGIPILFICSNENDDYFFGNMKHANCRKAEHTERWGKMVPIPVESITKENLIKLLE